MSGYVYCGYQGYMPPPVVRVAAPDKDPELNITRFGLENPDKWPQLVTAIKEEMPGLAALLGSDLMKDLRNAFGDLLEEEERKVIDVTVKLKHLPRRVLDIAGEQS